MSWTPDREEKLKALWKKGHSASQIALMLGETTRNAVIGKAHRLNLSAKIIKKSSNISSKNTNFIKNNLKIKNRKIKFRSLLLDKDFEPAKNLSLEELTENTCKYMEGHPDQEPFSFCGRKNVDKFSYCPLHLMMVFQPKGKKEDLSNEGEIPQFIEKKIKSA